MKIGVFGSGNIGETLARHFVRAGHQVGLCNSRGPESLTGLVRSLGPNTCAMTCEEAARFGEIILLAVPWRNPEALPRPEWVAGKIVIDAMNPYSAQGEVIDLGEKTSSEETAKRLPGARLVKAFNTLFYRTLATEARPNAQDRLALFVAGDDAEAKAVVTRLVEEIGFAVLDTGALREGGRMQQPGSRIYNRPMKLGEAREAVRHMAPLPKAA